MDNTTLTGHHAPMTGNEDWTQVGVVEVESGKCLVVDPTFHRDGFYGVDEVAQSVLDAVGAPSRTAALALADGHVVGTVILPGLGDDVYPVEVRYVQHPRWGRRVAELRIRFLKHE
jgi:hypothetical protein